jgi:hypothetical protein
MMKFAVALATRTAKMRGGVRDGTLATNAPRNVDNVANAVHGASGRTHPAAPLVERELKQKRGHVHLDTFVRGKKTI